MNIQLQREKKQTTSPPIKKKTLLSCSTMLKIPTEKPKRYRLLNGINFSAIQECRSITRKQYKKHSKVFFKQKKVQILTIVDWVSFIATRKKTRRHYTQDFTSR